MNFPTATLRRHIALTSAYINLKSYPSEKQNATVRQPNSTLQHICVGPDTGGDVVNVGGGEGGEESLGLQDGPP